MCKLLFKRLIWLVLCTCSFFWSIAQRLLAPTHRRVDRLKRFVCSFAFADSRHFIRKVALRNDYEESSFSSLDLARKSNEEALLRILELDKLSNVWFHSAQSRTSKFINFELSVKRFPLHFFIESPWWSCWMFTCDSHVHCLQVQLGDQWSRKFYFFVFM